MSRFICIVVIVFIGLALVPGSVRAMPPQESQNVAFSPNPIPLATECPGPSTALTITGTKWSGHYVQKDVNVRVEYNDGSQRDFGIVDIPQGGTWQTTIAVDCGMPYVVDGVLVIHVVLYVHDTSWKDGKWSYFVPVVWV